MTTVIEQEPVRATLNALARIRLSATGILAMCSDEYDRCRVESIVECIDAERDIIIKALTVLATREP